MELYLTFTNVEFQGKEISTLYIGPDEEIAKNHVPEDFREFEVDYADWPDPPEPFTAAIETEQPRQMLHFYQDGPAWYSVVKTQG